MAAQCRECRASFPPRGRSPRRYDDVLDAATVSSRRCPSRKRPVILSLIDAACLRFEKDAGNEPVPGGSSIVVPCVEAHRQAPFLVCNCNQHRCGFPAAHRVDFRTDRPSRRARPSAVGLGARYRQDAGNLPNLPEPRGLEGPRDCRQAHSGIGPWLPHGSTAPVRGSWGQSRGRPG